MRKIEDKENEEKWKQQNMENEKPFIWIKPYIN